MKNLILTSVAICAVLFATAQTPDLVSYQSIVRDAQGQLVQSSPVGVQISILQGSSTGTPVYVETHGPTTNTNGLVTFQIGGGTVVSGDFATIDWANDTYFILTETDPEGGTNYTVTGTSQLVSVPYALMAKTAETAVNVDDADADPLNEIQDISIAGHDLSITNGSTITLPDSVNDADADPTNEIQDISLSGSDLTISGGSTVSINDADADSSNELQDISLIGYDLSISNGSTITLPDSVNDADADPTNEIQDISLSGSDLTISGGSTVSINDADADSSNELQDISLTGYDLSISNGSTITLPDSVNDADADPTNELQDISLSGTDLTISGGSTVSIIDGDSDATNELQDISLSGTDLTITGGSTISINDADADSTNELVTSFGVNGTNLELADAGNTYSVALSGLGDTDWTESGTDIYSGNTGNVGIGTTSPNSKLAVNTSTTGALNVAVEGRSIGGSNANNYGVSGYAQGGSFNVGIYGEAGGNTGARFAGYFFGDIFTIGDIQATGSILGAAKNFTIDHPIDPKNKNLVFTSIESNEMLNVFSGNIQTDANGIATVSLPEYFQVSNKDFRYQLTVIGSFAQAIIAEKIANNQFVIQTNQPSIEVSWQVTGVRADKWANANRIEAEQAKKNKGEYIHPELYGKERKTPINQNR